MKTKLTYDTVMKEMEEKFGRGKNYEFQEVVSEIITLQIKAFEDERKGNEDLLNDQNFLLELKKEIVDVFTRNDKGRRPKYSNILKILGLNTFDLPYDDTREIEVNDPPHSPIQDYRELSEQLSKETEKKYTDILNRILDFELGGNQNQTLKDEEIKNRFRSLVVKMFISIPGEKAMKQKDLQSSLNSEFNLNLDESAISRLVSPIKNRYNEISLHDSMLDKYKAFLDKTINSSIFPSKEVIDFIKLSEDAEKNERDKVYQRANAKQEYPETWKEMWVVVKSKNKIISCSDYHKDCETNKKKNSPICIDKIISDSIEQFHIIVSDSFLIEFKENKISNPILTSPIICQRLNMNGLIISHFEKSLGREIKKNWNISKYRKEEIKNNAQRSGGLRPTRITKRR